MKCEIKVTTTRIMKEGKMVELEKEGKMGVKTVGRKTKTRINGQQIRKMTRMTIMYRERDRRGKY